MSGGKTGVVEIYEPLISVAAALPAVAFKALLKTGTNAFVQGKTAVEMTRVINDEKRRYQDQENQLRQQTAANKAQYEQNVMRELEQIKRQLRSAGYNVPELTGSAESQLTQLMEFCRTCVSAQKNSANDRISPIVVALSNAKDVTELSGRIFDTADEIILMQTSFTGRAQEIKDEAAEKLRSGSADKKALEKLYGELCEMLPRAKEEEKRSSSLRGEFNRELARVRALYAIRGKTFLFPAFSPEKAESQIIRLKEIAEEQIQLLDEIRKNPYYGMSPEDRKKAAEVISAKIYAVMKNEKLTIKSCFVCDGMFICYYSYHGALLKVSISETGMMSFEVVGDANGKTEFTDEEKAVVLRAMELFQTEFPAINENLKKQGITFTVVDSFTPEMKYVVFEEADAQTPLEQSEIDAAIIALQAEGEKYLYADET